MSNETNQELDWYEVLNCSLDSTKEHIERAARQLARKYHPDRNKDPNAAPLFLNVQKAKEFLLNDEKRRGYDEELKKKIKRKEYDQQRHQHMDSKRKKMKEDFEARLGKFQKTSATEEAQSVPRHHKPKGNDVDDIRKDSIHRMNEAREKQEAQFNNISMEEILKHRQSMSDSKSQETIVQIKIKWRRSDISHSDDSLCSLFRVFGSIEDVTMAAGGKTNTAIITFATHSAAQNAVNHYLESQTFKVTLLTNEAKKPSIFTHTYQNTATGSTGTASSFVSANQSSSNGKMESDLMREVRRAVERDELIKQMAASNLPHNAFSSFSSASSGDQNSHPATPSPLPPINLAAKENDILARMMAAKSAKSQSSSVPMKAA
jgi:curved DNA-binding protein CbpA